MTGRLSNNAVALHALGLAAMPLPVGGSAEAFLAGFDITVRAQFISLTGKQGPAMVRATAVSHLLPNVPGDAEADGKTRCLFQSDPILKGHRGRRDGSKSHQSRPNQHYDSVRRQSSSFLKKERPL